MPEYLQNSYFCIRGKVCGHEAGHMQKGHDKWPEHPTPSVWQVPLYDSSVVSGWSHPASSLPFTVPQLCHWLCSQNIFTLTWQTQGVKCLLPAQSSSGWLCPPQQSMELLEQTQKLATFTLKCREERNLCLQVRIPLGPLSMCLLIPERKKSEKVFYSKHFWQWMCVFSHTKQLSSSWQNLTRCPTVKLD